MKKLFRLTWADVSRHRPVLYGFAALWIAFLRMEYKVPHSGGLRYLRLFQSLGACGVEMFVLLTGAGLYRSMEHDPDVRHFYKKRFSRVFLPAVIVSLIHFGTRSGGVLRWLTKSFYFPYWLGIDTFWYVAFILTMYLLYPLVYRIQKTHPLLLWAAMVLSLGGALGASMVRTEWTEVCLRGVARIPVFLLGCMLAPCLERGFEFPIWTAPASFACCAGFYYVATLIPEAFYFWRTLGYIGLAVFFILTITWLCEHMRLGAIGRFGYRCIAFCGGISLEIYLLFDRICLHLEGLPRYSSGEISRLQLELVAMVFTLLGGWLLTHFSHSLTNDFSRLQIPNHDERM